VSRCENLGISTTILLNIYDQEREYLQKTIEALELGTSSLRTSHYENFLAGFIKYVKLLVWLDKTVLWGATKSHIPETIKLSQSHAFLMALGKSMPNRYNLFKNIFLMRDGWSTDKKTDPYNIITMKQKDEGNLLVRSRMKLPNFNI
jgi:hypothetical protein